MSEFDDDIVNEEAGLLNPNQSGGGGGSGRKFRKLVLEERRSETTSSCPGWDTLDSKTRGMMITAFAIIFVAIVVTVVVVFLVPLAKNYLNAYPDYESYKLPENIKPESYILDLTPDMVNWKLNGIVRIKMNVVKPTRQIVFHGHGLKIIDKKIWKNGKRIVPVKVTVENKFQVHAFYFRYDLPVGPYEMELQYQAPIYTDKLSGAYRANRLVNGNTVSMMTTDFEPTDARSAFPCFDQPDMKANFTVIMNVKNDADKGTILSNMPEKSRELNNGVNRITFETSPKMSTYLVVFIVCDYHAIEKQIPAGPLVRVWVPKEKNLTMAQFALDATVATLPFYGSDSMFGHPFPLPKMDLIAIPDYKEGGMENWGCITFAESQLYVDPVHTSPMMAEVALITVTHELAHQWFGDLVTMEWWDDLWLNEGFATYVSYLGANNFRPNWEFLDKQYSQDTANALLIDSQKNTHQIQVKVTDPASIGQLFDTISYQKGQSVLRMLKGYMDIKSPGNFNAALKLYISRHAYGNAKSSDLWNAFKEVSNDGLKIPEMMESFLTQPGYPLLTVQQLDSTRVQVNQQRYFADPGQTSNQLWYVPFNYRMQGATETTVNMLENTANSSVIPFELATNNWLKANWGEKGFYRVNYPNNMWDALITEANNMGGALQAVDRAGLVSDALHLASSGQLDFGRALSLTKLASQNIKFAPMSTILGLLSGLRPYIASNTKCKQDLDEYLGSLLNAKSIALGWTDATNDDHNKMILRSHIQAVAGLANATLATKNAIPLFTTWLNNPASINANMLHAVLAITARWGSAAQFTQLFDKFKTMENGPTRLTVQYALTNTQNPNNVKTIMDFMFSDKSISQQAPLYMLSALASNPELGPHAFQYFKDNYNTIFEKYGATGLAFPRVVKTLLSTMTTSQQLNDVKAFFNSKDTKQYIRGLNLGLDSIEAKIAWKNSHETTVCNWLAANK